MEISYIAGFFDADGCLSCGFNSKQNKVRRQWWPSINVRLANTNRSVLIAIQKRLGFGRIYKNKLKYFEDHKQWSIMFYFIISKMEEVITFIDLIYPHSVAKRKQLRLGRQAASFIEENRPRVGCVPGKPRGTMNRWSEKNLQAFNVCFVAKIKELKLNSSKRGRKRIYSREWDD